MSLGGAQPCISSVCCQHASPYGRIKSSFRRTARTRGRGVLPMSGIVGIVGGPPAAADLLRRMTDGLAFRGPDAKAIRANGCVGFGHTTLATGDRSRPAGIATLEGRVLVADARLDGRAELAARLRSRGHQVDEDDTNQLILHAYVEWGEDCVNYLAGDFSFAIWDDVRRRLFCARDRFGVRPFYYADTADGFVFSNTLDCVRLHPPVKDTLNESAIGDFLLFGYNLDDTTTTFAEVKRLPPAHVLTYASDVRVRRYWAIPTDGCVRYSRSGDYVEHFRALFDAAVSDRLPATRAGISMSGGLDSTAVAATAQRLARSHGGQPELRAHTIAYDSLIPDQERTFAGLAAAALDLESSVFAADGHPPFEGWDDLSTPEPTDDPFFCMRTRQLQLAADSAPVLLCGEGGDELLWGSYVVDVLGRMPLTELARDIVRGAMAGSRRPGLGLRRWVKRRFNLYAPRSGFPVWIDPGFSETHGLRARWHAWHDQPLTREHPLRPEAYRRLVTAPWAWYFEAFDPGGSGVAIELRYPFLDLRVVEYLLALPPIPWCVDKHLLRVAMRGMLPDVIRNRPKAPLAGNPLMAHLQRSGGEAVDRFEARPELAGFVNREAIPRIAEAASGDEAVSILRPYCLNNWLRREDVRARTAKEISHDRRAVVSAG